MSGDPVNIDRMDYRINRLAASLFFDPVTLQVGADRGVDDMVLLYAAGRGGVLGDATATQVISAFAFFDPNMVRTAWSKVGQTASAPEIAQIYADGMAAAARERWAAAPAEVVVRVGRTVLDGVEPLGMALFAGWREMPVPDDPLGAAAIVMMALRELRGDVHVQSVAASGLSGLEAEMATQGEFGAKLHGWPEPWPDPEPLKERLAGAQAATSARMAAIYATLSDGDLADLDAAVGSLAPR
jgi:hypothetical protein